jgi:lipopolysaccharide transport system ATP-binding protein
MNLLGKEDPYLKIGEVNDRAHKGESEYVWALKDINFEVEQGDVLGIIGKNGAGKSTLLKILSKVTSPTTGSIKARGRIASLLEVGTGFHPEMTGRENIYMNGAIMGMTKAEINRKLDEIVDFSGVERYLDTPVKRYSSGMTVRLGFAIAAHLDPEILVVDEVLAVGDAEFQKKAIGKMQDVSKGEGRTVLFVSHNMDSMLNLCKTGIVLQNGELHYNSNIKESVNIYLEKNTKNLRYEAKNFNKSVCLKSIKCVDSSNRDLFNNTFNFNDHILFYVSILNNLKYVPSGTVFDISFYTENEFLLFSTEYNLSQIDSKESEFNIEIPQGILAPGNYIIECAIHQPNIQIFDLVRNAVGFTIHDNGTSYLKYNGVFQGVIIVNANWKVL